MEFERAAYWIFASAMMAGILKGSKSPLNCVICSVLSHQKTEQATAKEVGVLPMIAPALIHRAHLGILAHIIY